jgi:hypothetical protein
VVEKRAKEPKKICNIRSHGGDLNVYNWRIEPILAYISDDECQFSFMIVRNFLDPNNIEQG